MVRNKQKYELIAALPEVLQRVRELAEICELEQGAFDGAWQAVQSVLAEMCVYSCGEVGIERWEKLLKIVPREEVGQDERVRAILFRLNEQLPFTTGRLCQLLDLVAPENGYQLEMNENEYELVVRVSLYCKAVERLIVEVLERTLPANISWELYWEYNRHWQLGEYKHSELAALTHYQMREEVIA